MCKAICSTCGKPVVCYECEAEEYRKVQNLAYKTFDGITFERIGNHKTPLPSRGTRLSAGLDFTLPADVELYPGETKVIPCGFKVQLPDGHVGLMKPRSSSSKLGLRVTGTIDADYRGEIGITVHNASGNRLQLKAGQRYAQLIVLPIFYLDVREAAVEMNTERGTGGFGSTGT